MRRRAPMKFTIAVSRSENGGPGSPAQLNTASIGPSICATTESIDAGSSRFSSIDAFTGVDTGFRSRAVTLAPSSWQIRATCSPMPDAAPVTTTCLPSYPSTSSMGAEANGHPRDRHFRRECATGHGVHLDP